MLNLIWLGLIVIGIVTAMFTGNVQAVTDAAIEYANLAVEICIGLIGMMTLWLGIMKIAEKAGLTQKLGILLSPIMTRLFKDVPKEHPAMGAMLMNISANMLGLGNAATPLGIKAMQELEDLNKHKGIASDSQIMFLAINTSSVTLIPATVIGLRVSAGSSNPTEVVGAIILATAVSTITAVILAKLFAKMKRFKVERFVDSKPANPSANEDLNV
jgi:spore maturation protein A